MALFMAGYVAVSPARLMMLCLLPASVYTTVE
jgi:hypothetical protein